MRKRSSERRWNVSRFREALILGQTRIRTFAWEAVSRGRGQWLRGCVGQGADEERKEPKETTEEEEGATLRGPYVKNIIWVKL